MPSPVSLHQTPLEDLVDQILVSCQITRAEERWLTTVLYQDHLDEDQQARIQRVFYGLRHGLLTVVD